MRRYAARGPANRRDVQRTAKQISARYRHLDPVAAAPGPRKRQGSNTLTIHSYLGRSCPGQVDDEASAWCDPTPAGSTRRLRYAAREPGNTDIRCIVAKSMRKRCRRVRVIAALELCSSHTQPRFPDAGGFSDVPEHAFRARRVVTKTSRRQRQQHILIGRHQAMGALQPAYRAGGVPGFKCGPAAVGRFARKRDPVAALAMTLPGHLGSMADRVRRHLFWLLHPWRQGRQIGAGLLEALRHGALQPLPRLFQITFAGQATRHIAT